MIEAIPIRRYESLDYMERRKMQALMWLVQYGRYDCTTFNLGEPVVLYPLKGAQK